MGPRNRRRLVAAGITLGLVAAFAVGGVWLGHSSHSATSGKSVNESPAAILYSANRSKVVFGMTHQQVRRLVGPPAKVVGNCWQYPPYNFSFRGKNHITADRLCFYGDRYTVEHFETNGKWGDPPTRVTLPG